MAKICDSYTLLELPGQPKWPKMKHVPRQRGLWTPPPGVSTAIFRDTLRGIHPKKRNGGHVDLSLPYNIKSDDCPQDPGGSGAEANLLSFDFYCPLAHWGEPFHCPRQGVSYRTWGSGLPPKKKDEGGRGARVAGGQKGKRRSSTREVDGGGILEEAFPARWNLWTATL